MSSFFYLNLGKKIEKKKKAIDRQAIFLINYEKIKGG